MCFLCVFPAACSLHTTPVTSCLLRIVFSTSAFLCVFMRSVQLAEETVGAEVAPPLALLGSVDLECPAGVLHAAG